MRYPFVQAAGRAPEVESVLAVALYDAGSGRIVHQHTVCTLAGGRAVPEQEAVEAARRHASARGHPVQQLKVAVTTNVEHLTAPHRIDPATGSFARLPDTADDHRGPASAS
jgi:hypothetical protein